MHERATGLFKNQQSSSVCEYALIVAVLLLTHAVTLLSTHGWEHTENPSFGCAVLDAICQWFGVPLNLVQQDYKVVWWKLFNAVDAKKWSNVLAVIELLFYLPIANGRVERVFSLMKLIKNS